MGAPRVDVPADAAELLASGHMALLPTDTVYGIACAAAHIDACRRLYALKQRPLSQATAIMAGSVDGLARVLPELDDRITAICCSLLPGPLTLIVPNPARRLAHVCGGDPDRIGVRVPVLAPAVAGLADAVGSLLITSANERGGADPARLDAVPASLATAVAIAVDGGTLDGVPSSVIDVTTPEPRVLRSGPGLDRALEVLR
jgi:L-threonylcarbamoyladenylate synthase